MRGEDQEEETRWICACAFCGWGVHAHARVRFVGEVCMRMRVYACLHVPFSGCMYMRMRVYACLHALLVGVCTCACACMLVCMHLLVGVCTCACLLHAHVHHACAYGYYFFPRINVSFFAFFLSHRFLSSGRHGRTHRAEFGVSVTCRHHWQLDQ